MHKYEIMFIVKATNDSKVVDYTADTFKKIINDAKGKVNDFRALGEKKLAYPIKKQINGYYFLMQVETDAKAVQEFDRKALIDDNIIRHLIINLDKE